MNLFGRLLLLELKKAIKILFQGFYRVMKFNINSISKDLDVIMTSNCFFFPFNFYDIDMNENRNI